jgi:PmbA protein
MNLDLWLEQMRDAGADQAEIRQVVTRSCEIYAQGGEISLLRDFTERSGVFTALVGDRRGRKNTGYLDDASVQAAIRDAVEIATASEPDPAVCIAPALVPQNFEYGPLEPDRDRMVSRLQEWLEYVRGAYPKAIIDSAQIQFTRNDTDHVNSNGVRLHSEKGLYSVTTVFSAKDDTGSASFNYTVYALGNLDRPLREVTKLDDLLRESVEHIQARPVQGAFTGDLLIAPEALTTPLAFLTGQLGDEELIAGRSIYREKLGQSIASPLLTLRCPMPGDEFPAAQFVTYDGRLTRECAPVEQGMLNSFMVSLYGARKTGLDPLPHNGFPWSVDAGESDLFDMIRSIKRGVLLRRFSGGRTAADGSFSGVAKNSFYIEDGEIRHPLAETMISGNYATLLNALRAVSRERTRFGNCTLPWVLAEGVTVSGQ